MYNTVPFKVIGIDIHVDMPSTVPMAITVTDNLEFSWGIRSQPIFLCLHMNDLPAVGDDFVSHYPIESQ